MIPARLLRYRQPRCRIRGRQDLLNQLDTTTVALDANTGQEVWRAKQGDYKVGQTVTLGAAVVIKGKVILRNLRRRVRRGAASSPQTTSARGKPDLAYSTGLRPTSASLVRSKRGRATRTVSVVAAPRGAARPTTRS